MYTYMYVYMYTKICITPGPAWSITLLRHIYISMLIMMQAYNLRSKELYITRIRRLLHTDVTLHAHTWLCVIYFYVIWCLCVGQALYIIIMERCVHTRGCIKFVENTFTPCIKIVDTGILVNIMYVTRDTC